MPLKRPKANATMRERRIIQKKNIEILVNEGKPIKQAIAIASKIAGIPKKKPKRKKK